MMPYYLLQASFPFPTAITVPSSSPTARTSGNLVTTASASTCMKVVLLSLVFVMSSYNRWGEEITKVTYKNILISKSYDMFEINSKLEMAFKNKVIHVHVNLQWWKRDFEPKEVALRGLFCVESSKGPLLFG